MPTREEIVKALRCEKCVENNCPYYCVRWRDCNYRKMTTDAADLIEQQAKEIEQLQAQHELLAHQYEELVNISDKWCEERDAAVSISITLKYELAEVKAERDAAITDIEKLMSEVGLQCWEACEFCGMYDDDECIRNAPHKGQCKAKWRGAGDKPHVD